VAGADVGTEEQQLNIGKAVSILGKAVREISLRDITERDPRIRCPLLLAILASSSGIGYSSILNIDEPCNHVQLR
jgi:hypothetical protein